LDPGLARARIRRYSIGRFDFIDMHAGPLRLERSIARVAGAKAGQRFIFGISGAAGTFTITGHHGMQRPSPHARLVAVDLDQPLSIALQRDRFSVVIAPRALVESIMPEAATLHARVVGAASPQAQHLIAFAIALTGQIVGMTAGDAERALRNLIGLFVDVFGRHARLAGTPRAAARAAMFALARAHIRQHACGSEFTVGALFAALQLPRGTLYRLFEHGGGIAAYIAQCRLRAAADEIAAYPDLKLKDIAYGAGFHSASAFSRAFHREYGMTPQHLREYSANKFPR
jgi:AraC-like DNA-binding protein